MSSDVMIVCKEFKNQYDYLSTPDSMFGVGGKETDWDAINKWHEEHKPVHEAVFIDEASMGESWHEFGKWFVDHFYNGHGMIAVLTLAKTQEEIDKMQNEIFDKPLTFFDYKMICEAMDQMECHEKMDKGKVKDYLNKCIGKSISTENW